MVLCVDCDGTAGWKMATRDHVGQYYPKWYMDAKWVPPGLEVYD
jgi:hypothetical protein